MAVGAKVIIHVGLAKTATTLLQRALFSNHPQIECIGKPRTYEDDLYWRVIERITEQDEIEFNRNIERFRSLEVAPLIRSEKVNVLSDETLSGFTGVGRVQKAKRLSQVFDSPKIMVVIRNQLDILGSFYLQHIKQTNTKGYCPFEEWVRKAFETRSVNSPLLLFNYADLVELYCNLFGADHVKVFLYEDLIRDADRFIEDISGYLGVDSGISRELANGQTRNVRLSKRYMGLLRWKVALLPRVPRGGLLPGGIGNGLFILMQRGPSESVSLPEDLKLSVMDYFRADNRRLIRDYGVRVDGYGYPV
jgi:hypothetical protein